MFRGIYIIAALIVASLCAQAFAGVTAESFTWERSGRFFLNVTIDGAPTEIKGNLRIGETVQVKQDQITADLKSYATGPEASPAISVILSTDGNEVVQVILIQADGDKDSKTILNRVAIADRKATVAKDMDTVLSVLKQKKQWNTLAAFQWVKAWNEQSPGKQFFQFADRLETDADIALPKPTPRGQAGDDGGARTPQVPGRPSSYGQRQPYGQPPPQYGQPQYGQYDDGSGVPPPPGYGRAPGQPMNIDPQSQQYGDVDQYGRPIRRGPPPPPPGGYGQRQPGYGQSPPQYGQQGYGQQGYDNGGYPPPPPQRRPQQQQGFPNFFGQLFGNN